MWQLGLEATNFRGWAALRKVETVRFLIDTLNRSGKSSYPAFAEKHSVTQTHQAPPGNWWPPNWWTVLKKQIKAILKDPTSSVIVDPLVSPDAVYVSLFL